MSCFRPGGISLTLHALSFSSINTNSRLLDIGCGHGESLSLIKEKFACHVAGIEPDEQRHKQAVGANLHTTIKQAYAEDIPFTDSSFDIVLSECAASLFTDPQKAFKEISRVLADRGVLILTDVYVKEGAGFEGNGILRHLYTKEQFTNSLKKSGLEVRLFEDCGHILKDMLGQMIIDHGIARTYEMIGVDKCKAVKNKIGYALIVADRR